LVFDEVYGFLLTDGLSAVRGCENVTADIDTTLQRPVGPFASGK
jgi:hypothetical protein